MKTIMIHVIRSRKKMMISLAVSIQYASVTERQTDRQTDRRTDRETDKRTDRPSPDDDGQYCAIHSVAR